MMMILYACAAICQVQREAFFFIWPLRLVRVRLLGSRWFRNPHCSVSVQRLLLEDFLRRVRDTHHVRTSVHCVRDSETA